MLRQMPDLSLGEAARALGVSVDTLRRWDRAGRLHTRRDERNRRSARNRFAGVVRSVEADGVMALVELEAGDFLITAAITRDAVEELGLVEGAPATATVKATSVMIGRADPA